MRFICWLNLMKKVIKINWASSEQYSIFQRCQFLYSIFLAYFTLLTVQLHLAQWEWGCLDRSNSPAVSSNHQNHCCILPQRVSILKKCINITFLDFRMPDIMRGPKSHDIEHHMMEDILAHGNPAGYDVKC